MSPGRREAWGGREARAAGSSRRCWAALPREPRVRRCRPVRPRSGGRSADFRPGHHLLARTARQQVASGCPEVGFGRRQVLGRSAVASPAPQGETEIPFRAGHPLPTRLHQPRSHPPAQSQVGRQPTDPVAQRELSSLRSTAPTARAVPDRGRRGATQRSACRSSPAGSCFSFECRRRGPPGSGTRTRNREVPRAVPVMGGSRRYMVAAIIFQAVVLTMKFAAWVT